MSEEGLDSIMELLSNQGDYQRMERYLDMVKTTYSKYNHYMLKIEELKINKPEKVKPTGWGHT